MNNLFGVQVSDGWHQLAADLSDCVDHKWGSLLFQVDLHVLTIHELHDDVELKVLLLIIHLPHEVEVFDDVWVLELLGQSEFLEHLSASSVSQLGVSENFPLFVNVLTC